VAVLTDEVVQVVSEDPRARLPLVAEVVRQLCVRRRVVGGRPAAHNSS